MISVVLTESYIRMVAASPKKARATRLYSTTTPTNVTTTTRCDYSNFLERAHCMIYVHMLGQQHHHNHHKQQQQLASAVVQVWLHEQWDVTLGRQLRQPSQPTLTHILIFHAIRKWKSLSLVLLDEFTFRYSRLLLRYRTAYWILYLIWATMQRIILARRMDKGSVNISTSLQLAAVAIVITSYEGERSGMEVRSCQ